MFVITSNTTIKKETKKSSSSLESNHKKIVCIQILISLCIIQKQDVFFCTVMDGFMVNLKILYACVTEYDNKLKWDNGLGIYILV